MESISMNIQKPKRYRTYFTEQEDKLLTRIMTSTMFIGWKDVASHFNEKTRKQCRDRWINYLTPERIKRIWTNDEDQMIMNKVQQFGTKWTTIKKYFVGRSDNDIKNRYYSHIIKSKNNSTQETYGLLEDMIKASSTIFSIEDVLNIKI
jgi:hypothetical protein